MSVDISTLKMTTEQLLPATKVLREFAKVQNTAMAWTNAQNLAMASMSNPALDAINKVTAYIYSPALKATELAARLSNQALNAEMSLNKIAAQISYPALKAAKLAAQISNPISDQIKSHHEMIEKLSNSALGTAMSQYTKILSDPALKAAKLAAQISNPISDQIKSHHEMMEKLSNPALSTAMSQYTKILSDLDLSLTKRALMEFSPNIHNFIQTYIPLTDTNDDDFNSITQQEQQEAVNAIDEVFREPLNFQQKIMKWYRCFENKNPLVAKFFISLLLPIIIGFIINDVAVTTKKALLREKPIQSSPIINHIDANQSITIINVVPYYYGVPFTNPDTGETKECWISKRSVKLLGNEKMVESAIEGVE